jgi:hypothetical protein
LISKVRHHITEIMAGLLAGIGLGVGITALLLGHGSTTQHAARSTRSQVTQTPGRPSGPASAGVQPGREEPKVNSYSNGQHAHETSGSYEESGPVLDAEARASFTRLENSLPGHVELTVAPLGVGTPQSLGGDRAAHGWSTTKIPVLTALLKARGEKLTAKEQSWAQSAITESNNESVLHLFRDLESIEGGLTGASDYMEELFRQSNDEETVVATADPPPGAVTTFGQTEWKPSNAVKFFSDLARGCLLSHTGTKYVLDLMQRIESSESWGLGSAGFQSVAFKGGWGPEASKYLVRQSGIIEVGTRDAVAVSIVYFAPSFDEGQTALTETAKWLRRHLRLVARTPVECPAE